MNSFFRVAIVLIQITGLLIAFGQPKTSFAQEKTVGCLEAYEMLSRTGEQAIPEMTPVDALFTGVFIGMVHSGLEPQRFKVNWPTPHRPTPREVLRIVERYLEDHPDEKDSHFHDCVLSALTNTFGQIGLRVVTPNQDKEELRQALNSAEYASFRVSSKSMYPRFLENSVVLVSKKDKNPVFGDVVAFLFPPDPKTTFLMRVIGMPGDVLYFIDKKLTVNDKPAKLIRLGVVATEEDELEQYLEVFPDSAHQILFNPNRIMPGLKVTVPPEHFFVLGDNRDHSNDSRYWGFLPKANIIGTVKVILDAEY
jgi:signal peptidase I